MWRLLTWCNKNQITLRARHVPDSLNVIADGLSRKNQIKKTEWSLAPQIFKKISLLWERPQIDLFATNLNTKLPTYVSPIPDPQAWAVDALNISWKNMIGYTFPPHSTTTKSGPKVTVPGMQAHPDSPGMANEIVVLGSGGTVSRPSKTTPTNSLTTQTKTEQPIPCSPRVPQPPRMVSRSSILQNQGFSAEVADRIAAPQRLSTRAIYALKWAVFERWCIK